MALQQVLVSAGAEASICVRAGEYRLVSPIRPLEGQTITFESGAVLNGSKFVRDWTKQGNVWVAAGQSQSFSDASWLSGHVCSQDPGACVYEDLFRDDRPLKHVLSMSLLGPGRVYFDKAADKMYVTEDPTNHKMEATVATFALDAKVNDVTIRGATIEKFGWGGLNVTGWGWTIDRNEIRYAHGRGLAIGGSNNIVTRNYLHHNGNTGLVAAYGNNLLFEGNELAYNNYLAFGPKPTPHHEGGAKLLRTSNVIVRNNYSHHNDGDGWWFDTDNIDVLVEDNVFSDNTRYGFFYEVSLDAVIKENVFRNNGTDRSWYGSGIRIATSKNVEIYNNLFDDNKYSTMFVNWEDRGDGDYGIFETTNLYVHHNIFRISGGWIGSSWGKDDIAQPSANNRFDWNQYIVPDLSARHWIWRPDGYLTWDQWRALGFEQHGTLSRS